MKRASWQSMTGYTYVEDKIGTRHFKVQIKSVNHRFFEFRFRGPRSWHSLEIEIRNLLKDRLQRGSFDIWVDEVVDTSNPIQNDRDANLKRLGESFQQAMKTVPGVTGLAWKWLDAPIKAYLLIKNSELWLEGSSSDGKSLDFESIKETLVKLCDSLEKNRKEEGARTQEAVIGEYEKLSKHLRDLKQALPTLKQKWQEGLKQRLSELSEEWKLKGPDEQRIYQEFLMIADKKEVSEELQRIDSHLKALADLIAQEEKQAGKKLDFIAQELNREFTTLNNKIQDAELARNIGLAKLSVEALREQSLNLL